MKRLLLIVFTLLTWLFFIFYALAVDTAFVDDSKARFLDNYAQGVYNKFNDLLITEANVMIEGYNIPNSFPLGLSGSEDLSMADRPSTYLVGVIMVVIAFISFCQFFFKIRTRQIIKRQQEYENITTQAITAIAKTIDAKDSYTNGHSLRVAQYTMLLSQEMGLKPEQINAYYYTALLHDIGKIGIPDTILKKPAALSDEEYDIIKDHVLIGGYILKGSDLLQDIFHGALYHHEKYDGSGYFYGLKGEEIPLVARVIGVADAYDAMAHSRPYREAVSKDFILSELQAGVGTQFDPAIADIMINLVSKNVIS